MSTPITVVVKLKDGTTYELDVDPNNFNSAGCFSVVRDRGLLTEGTQFLHRQFLDENKLDRNFLDLLSEITEAVEKGMNS